jgi:hypothetical protein
LGFDERPNHRLFWHEDELQANARPALLAGVKRKFRAMRIGDGLDHCESEAGSGRSGREEGLTDSGPDLCGNARSVILD